ncbi:MAG: laccase [Nitriliruptorales bacterium]|nr:laccase [Nitriliruptorales bacterium]
MPVPVPAPLAVAVPEDGSARLAFSRAPPEGLRAAGVAGADEVGNGSVSLVVGVDPAYPNAPLAARSRLTAKVGLRADQAVYAAQPHGCGVAVVGRADRGRGALDHADAVPGVDALVTTEVGVGLVVLAADCVPLLLVDPGRAVAAAHAGRRGLVAGIVPATLEVLARETASLGGGDCSRVVGVIGPAIGGCCYELPEGIADEVAAAHPEARGTTTWGTPSVDVAAGVVAQLRAAGIARIQRVGTCTVCDGYRWFSARASASTTLRRSASTGRHAGIVCRIGLPVPNQRFASARHSP